MIDEPSGQSALADAREANISLESAALRELLARCGALAPTVLSHLLHDHDLRDKILYELTSEGRILPAVVPPYEGPHEVAHARHFLRRHRNRALARTTLRELYGHADVDRTAREWSSVADACTDTALQISLQIAQTRNGPPLDTKQQVVPFSVLGMGKLAGQELNLGSDIDLCFFYATDEGAAGERTLHEHFTRVGAMLTGLLDEVTEDGFAFRVDLRLRPEGSRGAIVNALASAERYYETWGRPWERAAFLRSRPCAGDLAFGATLREALAPFVFRRAVDPSIAREVSKMLDQSRIELMQDPADDLKLGPGGIREAEFFVQSLQLIWGGQQRALRVPSTISAIKRLRSLGLVTHRDTETFLDAWAVLRRAEHRVQVMAPYATHTLPKDPDRRRLLSRSLGYASTDAFESALAQARGVIHELFSSLFADDAQSDVTARPASTPPSFAREATLCALIAQTTEDPSLHDALSLAVHEVLDVHDGETAAFNLLRLARKADSPLGTVGRERTPSLGPRLLSEVRDAPDPDRALAALASLFERVGSALPRYASRFAAREDTTRALIGLLGASEALGRTLSARPELIDAVLTVGVDAPDESAIDALLDERLQAVSDDDIEAQVGALRRVMREVELAVGLADMGQVFSAGEVARRLSALAEGVTRRCFVLAANELAERFGLREDTTDPLDGIAVFAMGSLAARELGYGGDVDVIVLFEGEGETRGGQRKGITHQEFVARLTQRAIAFMSMPHAEGPGYSVDTRLRPSGAQGTLVVRSSTFARYHQPGDPQQPRAASWERQALLRSRAIVGPAALSQSCAALIAQIAYEGGPPDASELQRLRTRMEQELGRETQQRVSIKYGMGGLVDVEFAAQAMQMKHGSYARVRTPTTRHAIAALRDEGLLAQETADSLLHAEKVLRRALLASRLVLSHASFDRDHASVAAVARKLGYRTQSTSSSTGAFLRELDAARVSARRGFEQTLGRLAQ
ncbi:MAG: bifunctional [glutamate--ammonia ligase]-adenylyl-L-tyrosine phosphorylase/[glutamate--ammonia-ligase] adenylyltransferase [Deltaproteobacteria bacterium]|nr:bifunctional [glutamate--ammonia ligase]-adenylyl-L-tyrosine phosphorylase/[glutamate--ammonia-ligase] adenylyltransferase [Deltaproteobacteria bacterium]